PPRAPFAPPAPPPQPHHLPPPELPPMAPVAPSPGWPLWPPFAASAARLDARPGPPTFAEVGPESWSVPETTNPEPPPLPGYAPPLPPPPTTSARTEPLQPARGANVPLLGKTWKPLQLPRMHAPLTQLPEPQLMPQSPQLLAS